MSDDAISFGGEADVTEIEGTDFTPTTLDEGSIKKKIGHDIYTDVTQAFDEMVSNAFSGVWEAVSDGYIDQDEGRVEISVQSDPDSDQVLFTFRDNGIGMPSSVVENVFLSFGKTLNGKNDSTVGRFGLGVASYPNLVGFENGRIWLETVSRETDEKTVGWYTIDGLYEYTENVPDLKVMSEGEYGTAYKAWLKNDISIQDVIHWTERVSDYNSIPITLTVNGSEREFTPETIYDKFDSQKHLFLEYEEEGIFKTVAGHDVPDDCVIIHRKMDLDIGENCPFKSNVFIKLYTEEQKVCEGPHKGKILVSSSRYKSLTETEQETKYVTEDDLDDETTVTPRIVGNRESLDDSRGFKEYVAEKLRTAHHNRVESLLSKLEDNTDFFALTRKEKSYLKLVVSDTIFDRKYRYNKYQSKIDDEFTQQSMESVLSSQTGDGFEIPSSVSRYLYALFDSTEIQKTPLINTPKNSRKTIRPIDIIEKCQGYDNAIYMGCSRDQKKYDAITDDNHNNVFVNVNSASVYELYEETLGWKKLKDVKKSYVEENLTVSDETKKKFGIGKFDKQSTSKKDAVIHFGRRQRKKKRHFLEDLTENGHISSQVRSDILVAFTDATDYKISNFYSYATRSMGLLTVTNSEYSKYLEGAGGVYTIDEIIDAHESTVVTTLQGEREVQDILDDDTCLVVQSTSNYYDKLLNVDRRELAERLLTVVTQDQVTHSSKLSPETYTDIALLENDFMLKHQFAIPNRTAPIVFTLGSTTITAPIHEETLVRERDTDKLQAALLLAPWADLDIYTDFVDDVGRVRNIDSLTRHMYTSLGGENMEILPDRWYQ